MRYFIYLLLISSYFLSCKGGKKGKNEVNVHELADPDKLCPYASTSASATAIERFMFQKLIDWDYEKGDFVGMLAVSKPKISEYGNGLKLDYEIRPEAMWDNGTPVTAYDVVFSFKAALNPKTNCEQIRPYLDFLADVIIDTANPKKFSVISNQKYILVEEYSGYWVIPEYIYDKEKIMRNFSISDFRDSKKKESLKGDKNILRFVDEFNSQKFSREKGFVVGSGPYEFDEWVTGSKLTLKKKKDWWGHKTNDEFLKNYGNIETIKFRIINDWKTATTAIKGRELDVARGIEYKIFNDLKNDAKFNENYYAYTPTSPQYLYIGLNLTNPKLKDLKVRQALAHAIDKKQIISTLLFGLATPTESMVQPDKKYYNKNLKKFDFNIALASKLLDEAGWIDSDGDGIRDKVINGKKIPLELTYKYNSGNDTRKNIGLIYKENLKKVGVELNIVAKEWTVFLEDTKKHDFEIYCGAWVGDPNVEDPKQIWHSESSAGGSNYVSYGDATSDKMIDDIRSELNETKRDAMYLKFQEKVHNELPYIFLFAPLERIAVAKKYDPNTAKTYSVRPGYDLGLWKMKE
ncbi:MAG: ABC transporter substrate-binding protein [Chitinophagales bacterium]|jgi:ABC-type transport system substrate-binding protein|nr:ABC transporter substrate-binding protein [Sphingobacteriales bacterium]